MLKTYWEARPTLPDRIRRALWRAEWSCSIAWADVALPIIVSGLEALLKTERHHATSQFVTRVPLLAEHVGLSGLSPQLCEVAYDGRSSWVHGAHVRLFGAHDSGPPTELVGQERVALENVGLFQRRLRTSVRRAIEDANLHEIFRSDDSIRTVWPA